MSSMSSSSVTNVIISFVVVVVIVRSNARASKSKSEIEIEIEIRNRNRNHSFVTPTPSHSRVSSLDIAENRKKKTLRNDRTFITHHEKVPTSIVDRRRDVDGRIARRFQSDD